MKAPLVGMLVGVLWGALPGAADAQSLADVARKEAVRRESLKTSGKVLTNADLPASAVVPPPSGEPSAPTGDAAESPAEKVPTGEGAPAAPVEGGTAPQAQPAAGKAAEAAPTDDEEGWRSRAERVNAALSAARDQVRQLKALADRLGLEMQASDPAIVQRATAERPGVLTRIAEAEARQSEAQAARQVLEQDARLAGVPPAWIR